MRYLKWIALMGFVINMSSARAQSYPDTLISLHGTLEISEQRYHRLKAELYEANAATRNVEVVKYSKLPSIDASYQAGFGTANNLTGIFYPYGILPMTGPPSTGNNYQPVTGSAASLLLNWQAETFGQRNAQIRVAEADAGAKQSAWRLTLFEFRIKVVNAYLDLLLAGDIVRVQRGNLARIEASLHESRVLSNNGLKPGVDTALFLSELSKAKIEELRADKDLEVAQSMLAGYIITQARPIPEDSTFLNRLPQIYIPADSSFSHAPDILFGQSLSALSQARESLLKKSYLPKLNVWGTGFARGSGFEANGDIKTWDGMGLSRYNYGAGVQLIFPIMKYGEVKREIQQQEFLSKAAQERIEQTRLELSVQQRIATSTYRNSMAVAVETDQQLKSGLYAFSAMQIRYNNGLVNFADLIQAQYNLLKAEIDRKKAYWDTWKALLLQAAVNGDEQIFLNEMR
jgi:outer membrane protein TolC